MANRTRKKPLVLALAAASAGALLALSGAKLTGSFNAIASPATMMNWPNSILFLENSQPAWQEGAYVGYTFSSPPDSLGIPLIQNEDVTLRDIQKHLRVGDEQRALETAQLFTKTKKWGRDRDAAWFVQGLLHREDGHHNSASEAFTKVRTSQGPLAPWAAFYEAEQDLHRGKPSTAVRECNKYLETWPDGLHVDACTRIIARGQAESGAFTNALKTAATYDTTHPRATISEQIELTIAKQRIQKYPDTAIKQLQGLACKHKAPLTGRIAEELLSELRAKGHENAIVPDDVESLKLRAQSLRDSGRRQEAWKLFQELVERSAEDPALTAWVEEEADVFGWSTRHWSFLEVYYRARYNENPTSRDAWNLYRVLSRNGKWNEAADWALQSQTKHRTSSEWQRNHEDVARILLMAKRYREARKMFDAVKARGGWQGRRAEFFAAFAAYSAEDYADAVKRFTQIIKRNTSYLEESRYWRAKTYIAEQQTEEAQADQAWIRENAPDSWYATLLNEQPSGDQHRGVWFGQTPKEIPTPASTVEGEPTIPLAQWASPSRNHSISAFGLIRWPLENSVLNDVNEKSILHHDPMFPPPSYQNSLHFNESDSDRAFRALSTLNANTWSELPAIYDLSRVGLYEWSGPAFSRWFDGWQTSSRYRSRSDHTQARGIKFNQQEWRELFMFTRDHYHTYRYVNKMETRETEEESIKSVLKYQFPLAHARYVWKYSHQENIDPYMMLGLMRQESNYNSIALSQVGARGAMQIMPRTGHLMANILDDTDFTAGDLEDPTLAVHYGIQYFGLLMKRYDNVFPLAIASYNGGPHNVSSWLAGTGSDMPIDEFVEHIPFRETRGYVKKVVAGYSGYISKYVAEDAAVVIPATPLGNHVDIVDF